MMRSRRTGRRLRGGDDLLDHHVLLLEEPVTDRVPDLALRLKEAVDVGRGHAERG